MIFALCPGQLRSCVLLTLLLPKVDLGVMKDSRVNHSKSFISLREPGPVPAGYTQISETCSFRRMKSTRWSGDFEKSDQETSTESHTSDGDVHLEAKTTDSRVDCCRFLPLSGSVILEEKNCGPFHKLDFMMFDRLVLLPAETSQHQHRESCTSCVEDAFCSQNVWQILSS